MLVTLLAWIFAEGRGRILSEYEGVWAVVQGYSHDGKVAGFGNAGLVLIDGDKGIEVLGGDHLAWARGVWLGTNGVLCSTVSSVPSFGLSLIDVSGSLVWSYETNSPISRPGVDSAGNVYFYGPNWIVHSLSSSGEVRWTSPYPSAAAGMQAQAPALATDGRVALFGAKPGRLVVLDNEGKLLWRDGNRASEVGRSGAIFAENGDLVVRDEWELLCYD
ncbi:MAG TPA: hypothetical protein DCY13_01190 [Verrucomicrobiales bacterium]|nr:hypothetical protein [Verrucomicrobiales bacterium]